MMRVDPGALVGLSANYGPNYHARSDTYDKVDLRQLRLNAAIAAAATWGAANAELAWGRQDAAAVERLVETTGLARQMKSMGVYQDWVKGLRGRR
jgi:carboxypeptidase Q